MGNRFKKLKSMKEFNDTKSDITELKLYLNSKFDSNYFNSEFGERVYDYVDEDDTEEYDGNYEETYTNLCMGGAIEYDILDEITKECGNKFPSIDKDILNNTINDHFIDNCDWYDPMIFHRSGE